MRRLALAACAACILPLAAAEPAVVAEVDGQPITRRQVEDALLRKEGAEQVQQWVERRLDALDWAGLADGDVLLELGGERITRGQLARRLLAAKGVQARQELVEIAVVEQALRREGILVTDALVAAEWARMRRRFEQQQAGKAERIDFDAYIRARERMTPEQFRAQPGFRMLAGIHALVAKRARAELDEAALRARFDADPERFRQHEAVDLQVLFMPWRSEPGPDGAPVVSADERGRLAVVAAGVWRSIQRGEVPFERSWEAFGRSWDPEAGPGGRIGWVERDGRREQPGSRMVARPLMDQAWRVAAGFPVLLPPIAAEDGMWIARVLGRRAERAPVFGEVRERVFDDLLDGQLEARTTALLADLRRTARVDWRALAPAAAAATAPATAGG